MLTCLFTRRRIGAWLDGALDEPRVRTVAAHVTGCPACQREAEELRRLRGALQRALAPAAAVLEPDWTGFWPGVVRGIEDGRRAVPPARARRRWRPRWALGGGLVAAVLASVTLWQYTLAPVTGEPSIFVSSADTDHPLASVMVYAPQEKDLAVVWVFGLDD